MTDHSPRRPAPARRTRQKPPGSVLVIATRQIGDVLLTTPLIRRTRRLWPNAAIDVIGFAETLGMIEGNPDIRRLIRAPSNGGAISILRFAVAQRLWRAYDLALVTQHSDRAHLLGFIAAPIRSGILPDVSGTLWWKRALVSHPVTLAGDRGDVHVVDEKLALLKPWTSQPERHVESVVAPPDAFLPVELERSLRDPLVVVHVPSMWRYKQWPVESFVELANALVAAGMQVVLTGGDSAGDMQKVRQVADALAEQGIDQGAVVNFCGALDFSQLTAVLRRSALYIGPDTSVTHLAAAVGTPTLALFGPTNPVRWGPRGPSGGIDEPWHPVMQLQTRGNVQLLQGDGSCVPCGRAGCDDHRESRSACLESIRPERVIAAALVVLHAPT